VVRLHTAARIKKCSMCGEKNVRRT
jgi:hypothetical protein